MEDRGARSERQCDVETFAGSRATPSGSAEAFAQEGPSADVLIELYKRTRARTEELAEPLSAEDQILQSMPDASPTKWHRAHTTWFFETFLLAPAGVAPVDPRYGFLFNSYYDAVGARHERARRGLLSRPSLAEVRAYRENVDARVVELLARSTQTELAERSSVVLLGVAHEQQHQELLLTDILHALADNPLRPAYRAPARPTTRAPAGDAEALRFIPMEGGLHRFGASPGAPFVFDNELPRHARWLEPYALLDRLVTVREMKAFIQEGAYRTPSLWLSDGWAFVKAHALAAPLHASLDGGAYVVFGLDGVREANDDEPVTHVSFYEADALARFLGARLPTEAEWEHAASRVAVKGNFFDSGALRAEPAPRRKDGAAPGGLRQMFGDAWEWTRSGYEPYPGYAPAAGALGEYNGKFMANQLVLRGGSSFTPEGHVRATYRNFWGPETRFQMTGVRLARDVPGEGSARP